MSNITVVWDLNITATSIIDYCLNIRHCSKHDKYMAPTVLNSWIVRIYGCWYRWCGYLGSMVGLSVRSNNGLGLAGWIMKEAWGLERIIYGSLTLFSATPISHFDVMIWMLSPHCCPVRRIHRQTPFKKDNVAWASYLTNTRIASELLRRD